MADYKCAFDEEGQRLAILFKDGRIRVWDCSSGKLRQELEAASSLDLTCTCLCWSKSRCNREPLTLKKRKRKRPKVEDGDNVALGGSDGSLLMLDVNLGELTDRLSGGHTAAINDLCFCPERDSIYSCSDDRHITEWNSNLQVNVRWKGDKHTVKAVASGPHGKTLLSAGRQIKLWDLETKELLQKFNGHSNFVSRLLWTPVKSENTDSDAHTSGFYFLSYAENDELINAWQVSVKRPDRDAVVAFMLPSSPVCIDFAVKESDDQPLKLIAGCKGGEICLISHTLNGKCTKPIFPNHSAKLVNALSTVEEERGLSVLAAKLNTSEDSSLNLVFGSPLKPVFENLDLSVLKTNTILEREIPENLLLNRKRKDCTVSEGATSSAQYSVVSDTNVVRSAIIATDQSLSEKSLGQEEVSNAQKSIPFSQRIRDFLPAAKLHERTERVSAVSTANLVSQALQRDDDKMLFDLIRRNQNSAVVRATMERLPIMLIVPFLKKLAEKIESEHHWIHFFTIWLKLSIEIHMTYLLSVPGLRSSLSGLYQIMEGRTINFDKLSRLHGRLDLVLTYASNRAKDNASIQVNKPLLQLNEDDSEAEVEYDILAYPESGSESEEEWSPSEDEGLGDKEEPLPDNLVKNKDSQRNGKGAHEGNSVSDEDEVVADSSMSDADD